MNNKHFAIVLLLVALAIGGPIKAQSVTPDTTRVREPEPRKTTFWNSALKVPSKVVETPFLAVEGVSRGLVYIGYDTPILSNFVNFFVSPLGPVYPIASFGGNEGLLGGLGLRFKAVMNPNDRLLLSGSYSTFKYSSGNFVYQFPLETVPGTKMSFVGNYHYLAREPFWGLGNSSSDQDEVSLAHESAFLGVQINSPPVGGMSIDLEAGFETHNVFESEDEDHLTDLDLIRERLNLPNNRFRSARLYRAGMEITYDWRDSPGQTTRGGVDKLSLAYHEGVGMSDDLRYFKIRADLSQYVELFSKRVLVFRMLLQSIDIVDPGQRPDLPFYLLSTLGGDEGLRGYRTNRFIGKELALASVEYRFPIWRVLDGYWFAEQGRVFESFTNDFSFDTWRYSFGTGIRMWGRYGEVFRFEVARSIEETRFNLKAGMSF